MKVLVRGRPAAAKCVTGAGSAPLLALRPRGRGAELELLLALERETQLARREPGAMIQIAICSTTPYHLTSLTLSFVLVR